MPEHHSETVSLMDIRLNAADLVQEIILRYNSTQTIVTLESIIEIRRVMCAERDAGFFEEANWIYGCMSA